MIEVERKVFEEIALVGVIAIAKNDLAAKLLLVMAHFRFDVGQLGVKLVCLVAFGLFQ